MTRDEFVAIMAAHSELSNAICGYFVNEEERDDGKFVSDFDVYGTYSDTIEVVVENWKNPDWSERRTATIEEFLEWYNSCESQKS